MNTYRHAFAATCPSDGDLIVYSLEIESDAMIRVEHIRAATAQLKHGYHEAIADTLTGMLPGRHRMIATHQGVEVETIRGAA